MNQNQTIIDLGFNYLSMVDEQSTNSDTVDEINHTEENEDGESGQTPEENGMEASTTKTEDANFDQSLHCPSCETSLKHGNDLVIVELDFQGSDDAFAGYDLVGCANCGVALGTLGAAGLASAKGSKFK